MSSIGGGLIIGVSFACRPEGEDRGAEFEAENRWFTPNAFVKIGHSGRVRIAAPVPEVGQRVSAALPRLVAHELYLPLDAVEIFRPTAAERFGGMAVAGSDAVVDYWQPLRDAGAAARQLLISAGAGLWGVAEAECRAEGGRILHGPSGRSARYGELVDAASALPLPDVVTPREWPTAGPEGAVRDPELEQVVRGTARFGIDVRIPDMLFATVLRPPVLGARLLDFSSERALAAPGVLQVVPIEPLVPDGAWYGAVRGGLAVIATSTWAAIRGRDLVEARWQGGAAGPRSDRELTAALRELAGRPPQQVLRVQGSPPDGVSWIERRFELPLIAHGAMEPGNFTARISGRGCEAWGPTQNPRTLQALVAAALEIDRDAVAVHPTRVGGGFGRRLAVDYGVEAALVARHTNGRPVQVVWTREDDVRQDYYRPPAVHRMRAALATDGRIVAWDHHLATSSLARASFGPDARYPAVYDVQGADEFPLQADFVRLGHSSLTVPLQLGSFRSVAHSFNVFAVQSFLDELAEEAGIDPLEFRRAAIGRPRVVTNRLDLPGRRGSVMVDTARLRRVLDAVALAGPWAPGARRGDLHQGIAFSLYKGTYVAHLAEVTGRSAVPRLERVVAAVDCGTVVDPDGVRAQVEGAVMDAIGTVFYWSVPFEDGRVTVSNFTDYRLPRMTETPRIEVLIVPSGDAPSGMGEPPYPSAVPAIATALGRALDGPVRQLPLSL